MPSILAVDWVGVQRAPDVEKGPRYPLEWCQAVGQTARLGSGSMDKKSSQLGSTVTAMVWFVFFVALIFRPDLVRGHPIVAVLAVGGCVWWAIQARRTGKRRRHEDVKRLH